MKRLHFTAGILAALLLAGIPGAALAAPKSDRDVTREVRDRAEIEDLMWHYTRAVDSFDPDAYVAVYTPDGAFGATKGRDALYKMIDALRKGAADRAAKGEPARGLQHMEMNTHLEFVDKDHARYHYYWLTVFSAAKPTDPPTVAAAGQGLDDVVRVGGKWLIQSRNVTAKDVPPVWGK